MSNQGIPRRRVLAGLGMVGVAGVAGGAGTYAYLSDEGEASFSFQSGSIVLKISPETIDFTSDEVSGDGTVDKQQDDGDQMEATITVQNMGTLPVGRLRIDDLTLSGPEDLQKGAEITKVVIQQPDGTSSSNLSGWDGAVNDANGNEIFDLHDVSEHTSSSYHLALMNSGQVLKPAGANKLELTLGITYNYESVTTNGGTLTADFGFEAEQQQS